LKPATALTTPTGRGIGIMAIDGIGGRDIGDGVTVIESGYTGITLVVRNLAQFQRHGGGRLLVSSAERCRLNLESESHRSESLRGSPHN